MRKVILAVFFMTSVLALSVSGQMEKRFVSKEGGFSVVTPAGFDKFAFDKTEPSSPGSSTTYHYAMTLDRGYCMMTFFDPPVATLKAKSVQQMLDDGRDGALTNSKGTLDSQTNLTLDGHPALSFDLHLVSGDATLYARTVEIFANSRIYALLYVAPDKAELAKPDIQKFFSSIQIQK